jgi:hypothetical protein
VCVCPPCGQAELRQKAHIQAIARKAENESSKVKEVSFINHLTSDFLRTTITERLTDVENRIQAGRARRLEHLHGIANRQKKKREKAKQMSERRLEMEQMAAERWSSLQARLEAVQERRERRFAEIQRWVGAARGPTPGRALVECVLCVALQQAAGVRERGEAAAAAQARGEGE